ncbi:MAG: alanine--tRNA ligase [Sphingobacteriaceae bacterium]|nr:alanine--tRNA ligase [Sphingobacteriaceae bacterium]
MTANEIRKQFLDFFQERGHQIENPAPIVVKGDSTLMFTNAGMNQFKELFLGNQPIKHPRVADTQHCLRVSGKHNDLEDVGHDTYHHTLFEMLGNWSFGDYFKTEAIAWAWELLTEVFKLDKDRLYVTVFEGDAKEGLDFDTDAKSEWLKWIAADRILLGNKKDNFWEMGEQGPCGPCSEIHIDLRAAAERAAVSGASLVNNDHPQVIEVWNLVFMEFNRKADGSLEKLPAKHVDTGMGFERLCRAIAAASSNYDTDVFQPLIQQLERLSGKKYGLHEDTDIAFRVIADHIRAITFVIADGQLPSNNKAGYVCRRILRRAIRYGYTFLGFEEAFMYQLVPTLTEQMGAVFTQLAPQQDFLQRIIKEEEIAFLRTLTNGLRRITQVQNELKAAGQTQIDGTTAFELFDTYGFPIDLTALIARENGYSIDEAGFKIEMEKQKSRSREAAKIDAGDWVLVSEEQDAVQFVGYDQLEVQTQIQRYRAVKSKNKESFQVVLQETPFYAESGGQVGDTGILRDSSNREIKVLNTFKENNLIVHELSELPVNPADTFLALVDSALRSETASNHSATHLLHAALRLVLGQHVEQKGSLVNSDYLRFDFSHFAKMSEVELEAVEREVNAHIRAAIKLDERRTVPIEEAKALGAMALFGEKYGDRVRVITFDPNYSVELCGGTHVHNTAHIGLFKITSESSIATGVRRIEAITGKTALSWMQQQLNQLQEVKDLLKNPKDLSAQVQKLLEETNALRKELEQLEQAQLNQLAVGLQGQFVAKGDAQLLAVQVEVRSAEGLKKLASELRKQHSNSFVVVGAVVGDKPQLVVAIGDDLVNNAKLNAGSIVREAAKLMQGGGGGQPFLATAGGSNVLGLPAAIEAAKNVI